MEGPGLSEKSIGTLQHSVHAGEKDLYLEELIGCALTTNSSTITVEFSFIEDPKTPIIPTPGLGNFA